MLEAGNDKEKALVNGTTPLMIAILKGQPDIVRILLEAGSTKRSDRCMA